MLPLSEMARSVSPWLAESGLLHSERQVLVQPMDVRVGDLAQKVVKLRGHAVVTVADLRAEGTQIDQEAEGIAVALGFAGHLGAQDMIFMKRKKGDLPGRYVPLHIRKWPNRRFGM
jgi:hypothetical protein